jgi:hypothetical protein
MDEAGVHHQIVQGGRSPQQGRLCAR